MLLSPQQQHRWDKGSPGPAAAAGSGVSGSRSVQPQKSSPGVLRLGRWLRSAPPPTGTRLPAGSRAHRGEKQGPPGPPLAPRETEPAGGDATGAPSGDGPSPGARPPDRRRSRRAPAEKGPATPAQDGAAQPWPRTGQRGPVPRPRPGPSAAASRAPSVPAPHLPAGPA